MERIALLREDLERLPSFSAGEKRGDPRFKWFTENFGQRCWELDAMHPNALRDRVADHVQGWIEPEAWGRCLQAQEAEQESLTTLLDAWINNHGDAGAGQLPGP